MHMLYCVWGPALHSVAPIAARILSSNAGERGPRANAECGNWERHQTDTETHTAYRQPNVTVNKQI